MMGLNGSREYRMTAYGSRRITFDRSLVMVLA